MSEENKEWIAPLVRSLLKSPPIADSVMPMTCPICDCDHQVYQGSGCFAPTSTEGTKLVCCFPTTGKMAMVDMPKDIKVGGLTSYVRYACQCGGHSWAMVCVYHKDGTEEYCVDLDRTKCKSGKPGKPSKGEVVFGSVKNISEHIFEAIKAQGAKVVPPTPEGIGVASDPLMPDHESPLALLPPTVRYAWKNFPSKKALVKGEVVNHYLPVLPKRHVAVPGKTPPHLAAGTSNSDLLPKIQEWLFALTVELKPESVKGILGMVYWGDLLIVVSQTKDEVRLKLTKDIAEAIIAMNKMKPNIYMMTWDDYVRLQCEKVKQLLDSKQKL